MGSNVPSNAGSFILTFYVISSFKCLPLRPLTSLSYHHMYHVTGSNVPSNVGSFILTMCVISFLKYLPSKPSSCVIRSYLLGPHSQFQPPLGVSFYVSYLSCLSCLSSLSCVLVCLVYPIADSM